MNLSASSSFTLLALVLEFLVLSVTGLTKPQLKEQALEMFQHAYWSYMKHAYPADELMPLSCKGRYRGITPSRGDVDDALGNFSLTLIDTLDTLVVVGMFDEFEHATSLVVNNVRFDSDLVVSVFETNIRVVGGLLGGHLMAKNLQAKQPDRMVWYEDQLLLMAKEVADRLLPAFNTTSGLPFPRINLKHGMMEHLRKSQDTCTACGGTMILEFAALSRLTGDPIYEEKAHKAMDFLWTQRHRGSDLMGTVLNIQNGDWIRRDSGVGAGIDSYYEYCLKAYVLLGDEHYLYRFNTHYDAIMRYVSQGPVFVDVHMHKPTVASRSFMDSLLAFWPGLQVLKGDLKPAIEMHEMLYQVMQKHNFLPEAFTHDFQVHWGQHPLRPEFVESTYFLYRATNDPHYLEVGEKVMESLNEHVRVPCGFTAIKDVRTLSHEDRMDSFVLAETFKYLYMLYAEKEDLIFDPENYIFTTEAHFLPLSLAMSPPYRDFKSPGTLFREDRTTEPRSCVNTRMLYKGEMSSYGRLLRSRMKHLVRKTSGGECRKPETTPEPRLQAEEFSAANPKHLEALRKMGISIQTEADGRVQLVHSANSAASPTDAENGLVFMQEMIELSRRQEQEIPHVSRIVQVLSAPFLGTPSFVASPAQFGTEITGTRYGVEGGVVVADPFRACTPIQNRDELVGKIAVVERSDCMFIEKTRHAEKAGAIGVIVIDHFIGTDSDSSPLFAMSGDGKTEVGIPAVFLFRREGDALLGLMGEEPGLILRIGENAINPALFYQRYLQFPDVYASKPFCAIPPKEPPLERLILSVNEDGETCVYKYEGDPEPFCMSKEEAQKDKQQEDDDVLLITYADGRSCMKEGDKLTCVHPDENHAKLPLNKPNTSPANNPFTSGPQQSEQVPNIKTELIFEFEEPAANSDELAETLLAQLKTDSNIAQLPNAENYIRVVQKLALRAGGDPAPMTKQEEELLGKLAYSVKPNSKQAREAKELDKKRTMEVYQDEDVVCAMNEKQGKLHCQRTKNPAKTLEEKAVEKPKHSEGGLTCYYEDAKGNIRCEEDP